MERNRRIAKAYSRVPVLSITGAEDGFDGYKIGMNGFDNPMRDALTKTVKRHIGKVSAGHTFVLPVDVNRPRVLNTFAFSPRA